MPTYRVTYETGSLLAREIQMFSVLKENEHLRTMISRLGLPLDIPETVLRDAVLETEESLSLGEIINIVSREDPGYVRFSSLDRI